MSGGFDDLLEHLLDEIAIRGNSGLSVADFKVVVAEYISSTWNDSNYSANTDQALLGKVWEWLLSYDDVHFEAPKGSTLPSFAQAEELEAQNGGENAANESTMESQIGGKAKPIRLFTNEDRVWQALTGHAPDLKLVPEKEYQLLQIISSAGKIGILQTELVSKSGQDNRSVPGRTDRLAQKGYIEKKSVFFGNERSFKTSWLCHSRYKKATSHPRLSFLDHLGSHIEEYSRQDEMRLEWIFDHVLRQIQSKEITVMDDMASSLGLRGNMRSERRMLDRVVDRLEIIGVVRRVKVPIEKEDRSGPNFLKCLRLLREPTEEDTIRARNVTKKQRHKFRRDNAMKKRLLSGDQPEGSEDDLDIEDLEDIKNEPSIVEMESLTEFQIEEDQDTLPTSIRWDPDEFYINQIWRAVHNAGIKGISTTELRDELYGPKLSKPVEHLMQRISERWEKSQPPHLRYLSIVRDTIPSGRTTQYHYRTFDNFQRATENGEASWDSIGINLSDLKKSDLDIWGFPKLPTSEFMKDPESQTLQSCINTNNYQLLKVTAGDPIVVNDDQGNTQVKFESRRAYGNSGSKMYSTVMTEDDIQSIRQRQETSTAAETPDMIRGIPKAEYHRIYFKKWQQQQQERKRLPQVTRVATLIAMDEAINQFNETAAKDPKSVLVSDPFNSPLFQKPSLTPSKEKKRPKLHKVTKASERSLAMSTRRRGHRNGQALDMPQQAEPVAEDRIEIDVEMQDTEEEDEENLAALPRKNPAFGFKRPITVSKERIKELVPTLADSTKPGLHVNANRQIFKWYKPKKESMILTFKFDWLREFDWFPEQLFQSADGANDVSTTNMQLIAPVSNTSSPLQPRKGDKYGVFRIKKKGRPKKGEDSQPYLILKFVLPALKKHQPEAAASTEENQFTLESFNSNAESVSVSKRRLEDQISGNRPHKQRKVSFVTTEVTSSSSIEVSARPVSPILIEDTPMPDADVDEVANSDSLSVQQADIMDVEVHLQQSKDDPNAGRQFIETENQAQEVLETLDTNDMRKTPELTPQRSPASRKDSGDINMLSIEDVAIPATIGRKRDRIPPVSSSPSQKLGGVRFKRSQLIMTIMEMAGGVIGEEREIVRAYQIQNERNGEPISDKTTVLKAVKNLVDQGKIRRITFSFEHVTRTNETKASKMIFRNLLLLPNISTNSNDVKEAMGYIKLLHPTVYLPPRLKSTSTSEKLLGARYFAVDSTITPDYARSISQAAPSLPALPPHVQAFHARQKELARIRQDNLDKTLGPRPSPKRPGPKQKRFSHIFLPRTPEEEVLQSYGTSKIPGTTVMSNDMQTRLSIQWPNDTYFLPQDYNRNEISDYEAVFSLNGDRQPIRYGIVPSPNPRMQRRRKKPIFSGYSGNHLHHMLQLLYPIQTFNSLTGTFSTFMPSQSRWNESDPSGLELAFEVNEWSKEGYSLRLLEDGQNGYVNYVFDQPNRLIQLYQRATLLHPRAWNRRAAPAAKLNLKCVITPAAAKRLLYSCVAVRTLVGSVDQVVSWQIIDHLFRDYPNYTRHNFNTRWIWMNKRHKDVVSKLQKDFEEAFLTAYENGEFGEFPPVYSSRDLDWEKIVNWAESTIDVESGRYILPESRDALNSYVNVIIKERDGTVVRESIDIRSGTAIKKQMMEHQLDFTFPSFTREQTIQNDDLVLAKSWARAAITSKSGNARFVNEKLKTLDDGLLRHAIDELVSDEILVPLRSKGDARHFQLSDKLETIVKSRPWNSSHYHLAVAFKKKLDQVFATKGVHTVAVDAADWEVMVIMEMYANSRVTIIPKLPPVNSTIGDPWPRLSVWGFAEGAYEAKKISRDHYSFEIEVRPTEQYIQGLPLLNLLSNISVPIKIPKDSPETARIPFWVDFEGNIIQPLWHRVLMVSLHAISLRAGVTVERLRSTMKKFVEIWEMDLLVDWLRKIGAVDYIISETESPGGLIVKEWWWMAMGEGESM